MVYLIAPLASSELCCKLLHCHSTLALCDNALVVGRANILPPLSISNYFLSKLARWGHSYDASKLWYWRLGCGVGKIPVKNF
jgi:hypothetical protein